MKPDVNLNLYNNSICSILDDVIALGEAARRLRADITQELHHAPPRMALVETDGLIGCIHYGAQNATAADVLERQREVGTP